MDHITYHPVGIENAQTFASFTLTEDGSARAAAYVAQRGLDQLSAEHLLQLQAHYAQRSDLPFDQTHGFAVAAIQGLTDSYFYAASGSLSALGELITPYTQPWQAVAGHPLSTTAANRVAGEYSSGVYVHPSMIAQFMSDTHAVPELTAALATAFPGELAHVLWKALQHALETGNGLLEAHGVVKLNPADVSASECHSNLANCELHHGKVHVPAAPVAPATPGGPVSPAAPSQAAAPFGDAEDDITEGGGLAARLRAKRMNPDAAGSDLDSTDAANAAFTEFVMQLSTRPYESETNEPETSEPELAQAVAAVPSAPPAPPAPVAPAAAAHIAAPPAPPAPAAPQAVVAPAAVAATPPPPPAPAAPQSAAQFATPPPPPPPAPAAPQALVAPAPAPAAPQALVAPAPAPAAPQALVAPAPAPAAPVAPAPATAAIPASQHAEPAVSQPVDEPAPVVSTTAAGVPVPAAATVEPAAAATNSALIAAARRVQRGSKSRTDSTPTPEPTAPTPGPAAAQPVAPPAPARIERLVKLTDELPTSAPAPVLPQRLVKLTDEPQPAPAPAPTPAPANTVPAAAREAHEQADDFEESDGTNVYAVA